MTLKKTPAWKAFSKYIRQRDKGKCFTCPKRDDPRAMDAGPFFHNCAIMFFDARFVRCQCTGCNRFKHGNLGIYAINLIGEMGMEEFKKAERLSKEYKNWHSASAKKELKVIKEKYEKLFRMFPQN